MKKLLAKLTLYFFLVAGFAACQKETDVITENNEETVTVKAGPGPMEFTQRGPGGSIVIYSAWIPKINSDWSGVGTHEVQTSLTAPSLNDNIVNNGVVLVYFKDGEGKIRQLNYTWVDDVYKETLDYTFEKQKILLYIRFFGGNVIGGVVDLNFRYVLIPGTQPGGRVARPVDYKDYDAVCEYYGIPR